MTRVRFAPSPTGSLHLGNALTAVANRRFADEHGGTLLLRIDDTDAARNVEGGDAAIVSDLEWLGVGWEEGPVRQSERRDAHRAAAERLVEKGRVVHDGGTLRFEGITLMRADGTPTYQLATAVDDVELGITHVIRGADHRSNSALQTELIRALGAEPPEFVHHGLILGDEGGKLSKRAAVSSLADMREAGIPAEAVRGYLEELGLPRGDVRLDLRRVRRLAVEAISRLSDEELTQRVGVAVELAPALRGARDFREAAEVARSLLEPDPTVVPVGAAPTLARFRELREALNGRLDAEGARSMVRDVKAAGGNLRALRLALTGRERGPELWAVIAALPRDEALRRVDAAL